ncbi:protein archease-like [Patiria miniata]|uniref:Archease domain-containing protein n=1 Tax=Patiria miniata TaxID=46514 RepID=A0A913ZKR2_PATMI|nr:protein archease-like [Patiria miniata]
MADQSEKGASGDQEPNVASPENQERGAADGAECAAGADGGDDGNDYDDDEGAYTPWQDIPPGSKFEFLDHTADVQLHSWGDTLKESFEQVAMAMFAYMTEISKVEKLKTETIEAEGDDMLSLLYHFLDEFLFVFSADPFFIPREITIDEFDLENFKIKATGHGETFDLTKHPQGTEVKAITYSNMQVHKDSPKHDVYVIIDI